MPLEAKDHTCPLCRRRTRCWMAITDRYVTACDECWDTERDGPLPGVTT